MSAHSGPADWWTEGTDLGRKHIATKGIIQNGLILNLDAGVLDSYSGTGSAWADLSGVGNNGTLLNSPIYDSSNSGSIIFNGTNNRVDCGTFSLSYLTISVWLYKTGTATNQGICRKNNGWALSQYNGTLQVAPGTSWIFYNTGYTIPLNTWVNIVYTYSGTGNSQSVYINGSNMYNNTNGSGAISGNTNAVRIGYDDNNWWWNGKISQINIYNRALSAPEVVQNFNALRARFNV